MTGRVEQPGIARFESLIPANGVGSTGWVRAKLPDSPASTPLPPGEAYITIEMLDFGIKKGWLSRSRLNPVFLSSLAFPQTVSMLFQDQVIDRSRSADGAPPEQSLLCRQVPFHGPWEGVLRLDAVRSERLVKTLLRLRDAVLHPSEDKTANEGLEMPEADEAGDAYESLLAGIGAAKIAELVAKKSIGLASKYGGKLVNEIAEMIAEQDGTKASRLTLRANTLPAETGDYVLCDLPAKRMDSPLELAPQKRAFHSQGRRVRNFDYAILRITTSTRHTNIDLIPGLGEDYRALIEVLIAGGDPTGARSRFQRRVRLSEHLIDTDRDRLLALVTDKEQSLRSELESTGQAGDLEGLLSGPAGRFAIQSLKDLWDRGIRAISDTVTEAPDGTGQVTSPPVPSRKPQMTPQGMSRFEVALEFALKWEGGFSDHPDDKGGPTNKGVTQKTYDEWRRSQGEVTEKSVVFISEEEMKTIYRANYWQAARCDRFAPNIDWLMFDIAVNSGPRGAARIIQRALNTVNSETARVSVDGVVGPQTIAAAHALDAVELGRAIISERLDLFDRIVKNDASQAVFLKGWRNRTNDLARAAGLVNVDQSLEGLEGVAIQPENTAFAPYVD